MGQRQRQQRQQPASSQGAGTRSRHRSAAGVYGRDPHAPALAVPLSLLQASSGNRAASRILARSRMPAVQRKGCDCPGGSGGACTACAGSSSGELPVSQPGDAFEREADHVAAQVMSMSGRAVQRACACDFEKPGNGGCAGCRTPAGACSVQRKTSAASLVGHSTAPAATVVSNPGERPLDPQTRGFMEERFGHDFSGVRVHTNDAAGQSALAFGAHAYTVGSDIVFGAGRYQPGTAAGRHLLAHELTHVVQQSGVGHGRTGRRVMRKGFESTVKVCYNVLESRKFEVSRGGLRVVLVLNQLDKDVRYCEDFPFSVKLTRVEDWWPDDDISTCEAATGGTRSFSFAKVPSGTYYLTFERAFDHPYCCLEGDLLVFDEPVAGDSESCTRDRDPTAMDIVHGALDIAGFIPVLGAIPDGVNAGIYALEGDWVNAGLSAVAMVPAWGDGVKLGVIAGKSTIKITEKAAIRLGEGGIVKGLKEVRAASKVEKAGLETTEEAAKVIKTEEKAVQDIAKPGKKEVQAAEKAEKELTERAAKKDVKKESKEKKKGGKWTCHGWSAVLQIPSALPEHRCLLDGTYFAGPPMSGPSEAAACLAAKHAFNAVMPRGCRPKHLDCRCTKR